MNINRFWAWLASNSWRDPSGDTFEIKFLKYPPSPLLVAIKVYKIARDHRAVTKTHGQESWMADMPWRG